MEAGAAVLAAVPEGAELPGQSRAAAFPAWCLLQVREVFFSPLFKFGVGPDLAYGANKCSMALLEWDRAGARLSFPIKRSGEAAGGNLLTWLPQMYS